MLPDTVVGTVEPAAEPAGDAGALAAAEVFAGGATALAGALVAAAVLGALLEGVVVELAAVPLLLLHAATSDATTSSHVGFRKQSGGSVWESNPPNPTASGRISFED